jgi:hypothetical protein
MRALETQELSSRQRKRKQPQPSARKLGVSLGGNSLDNPGRLLLLTPNQQRPPPPFCGGAASAIMTAHFGITKSVPTVLYRTKIPSLPRPAGPSEDRLTPKRASSLSEAGLCTVSTRSFWKSGTGLLVGRGLVVFSSP